MHRKFLLILLCLSLTGCAPKPDPSDSGSSDPLTSDAPQQSHLPNITATLAVCGDTMSHMPQTRDAYDSNTKTYDYLPMIEASRPWVELADYAVVNLETTLSGGPDYSGFPAFNSPDALGEALKEVGFDLISTANNHCMDRGYAGLARTLDVLDSQDLAHVGTYRSAEEKHQNNHGVHLADVGGIQVAFLSYTYGTNGIPVSKDHPETVNIFTEDYLTTAERIAEDLLRDDLEAAKALNPDLIAVMMHWGEEYQTKQNTHQEKAADFLFAHGADVILGGHPHVLQPMETRTLTDAEGNTRTGFICWSLGNFISSQNDPYTDTTVVLQLELTKNPNTDITEVTNVSYRPMFMLDREREVNGERYTLLDAHKSMEAYTAGSPNAVSESIYRKLEACVADCHEILGAKWDKPLKTD